MLDLEINVKKRGVVINDLSFKLLTKTQTNKLI